MFSFQGTDQGVQAALQWQAVLGRQKFQNLIQQRILEQEVDTHQSFQQERDHPRKRAFLLNLAPPLKVSSCSFNIVKTAGAPNIPPIPREGLINQ